MFEKLKKGKIIGEMAVRFERTKVIYVQDY
jgi:hypothetical protein